MNKITVNNKIQHQGKSFVQNQANHMNQVFNMVAGIEQTDEEILDDKIRDEAREEEQEND